ncbi:hypothetical protein L2E82_15029 [Cichorium intybus]|uniref:Uncharacterized protein n=1 Tax=Cichorium intybus TaxID=13427 RepID=A0ACB9F147_CICIN|nr:hypothetical protein L2E82_15029 [Cichorium intybus]
MKATLRRVHAAQKDDEIPPNEAIIAPLEAELKLVRMNDDNRALDHLSKSKEASLLDAERSGEISMAKASWVERLTQIVGELEEAVMSGGAAANVEEKKIFDCELARAKISANGDAVVIANYWKDTDKKVMPVKQWLEERRVFQKYITI